MRNILKLVTLLSSMNDDYYDSTIYKKSRDLSIDDIEKFKDKRKKNDVERKKQSGQKKFIIDGEVVYALNEKNAKRKLNKKK